MFQDRHQASHVLDFADEAAERDTLLFFAGLCRPKVKLCVTVLVSDVVQLLLVNDLLGVPLQLLEEGLRLLVLVRLRVLRAAVDFRVFPLDAPVGQFDRQIHQVVLLLLHVLHLSILRATFTFYCN